MTTTKSPSFRSEAHAVLARREQTIAAAHGANVEAALAAINADRRARWVALLAGREESAELRGWAGDMEILHASPTVRVWRNRLPWLTALYVVRYGEAEDNWPPQLSTGDLDRARRWFTGDHPEGVVYSRED